MRTVAHLVWTYFTGTRLGRGLTVLGLLALAVGDLSMLVVPAWTLGSGYRTDLSELQEGVLVALPWAAVLMLFFASALMPAMIDRIALGRQICALPQGRLRLLASVVATAGLVALATAGTATLAFYKYPVEIALGAIFARTFVVAYVGFGLVYVAVWILSKMRTGAGNLAGSLLVIFTVGLALRYIGAPAIELPLSVTLGMIGWGVFSVLFLAGQRVAHALVGARTRVAALRARWLPPPAYAAGMEADLLLGTTRPWILALGQGVPIGIAAWYIPLPAVWLFFLTLFSAISGAVTTHAAARSRRLWLRAGLTRAELFRRVERAYWRYNGYALGVLLLLLAGVGSYLEFPTSLLALGLPLVLLGAVVSSYLGLMTTKGLGWGDAALAVVTMGMLMATSVAAARTDVAADVAVGLEVALALLAVLYRLLAQARWNALDWMVCRGDAPARRSTA